MIYEWYSGSDKTLQVAKRLEKLNATFDDLSSEERLVAYQGLLDQEHDPNWRASILHTIGWIHRLAERWDTAFDAFKKACETYDPLAANFSDVEDDYCRSHYFVAVETCPEAEPTACLRYAFKVLPFLNKGHLDEFETALILGNIGSTLNELGHQPANSWAYSVALTFHAVGHHIDPEDPGNLESLLYTYLNIDDRRAAQRVLDMFAEVGGEYEHRDRVLEFAREEGLLVPESN